MLVQAQVKAAVCAICSAVRVYVCSGCVYCLFSVGSFLLEQLTNEQRKVVFTNERSVYLTYVVLSSDISGQQQHHVAP